MYVLKWCCCATEIVVRINILFFALSRSLDTLETYVKIKISLLLTKYTRFLWNPSDVQKLAKRVFEINSV